MSDVKLKFIKLDGRYKGHNHFNYCLSVEFSRGWHNTQQNKQLESIAKFNEIRDWCIKNWGTSTELADYDNWYASDLIQYNFNEHWSWSIEESSRRIYLKTDKERMWAELTWK